MLFLTFLALIPIALYVLLKQHYSYWEKRNVPYEKPVFLMGNMQGVGKRYHWRDIHLRIYNKFKNTTPVVGFYTFFTRAAFILDLDLIKQIMIKDFQSFSDRGVFHNERDDPLTGNLLFLDGEKWRVLRQKLTNVFTTGKIKYMLPLVVQVADNLEPACEKLIKECEGIVEAKDLCGRYAVDVIGSCAFGLECKSLIDPDTIFRKMCRSIIEEPRHNLIVQAFMLTNPDLARKLRMKFVRDGVCEFFMNVVKETVEYRQKNNIKRNDFMDLMIEMKESRDQQLKEGKQVDEDDFASGLTIEKLVAQAVLFLMAGYESSSTTISFGLYELALNQEIQDKLRNEISKVLEKHDNKLTYESLKDMKYLKMVVSEIVRKYTIAPQIFRRCVKDFQVPNTNIVFEKGLNIIIPVDAIHHDPDYYPDPEKFHPDRFLPEEIAKRSPLAYLPFGYGPRNCIGMRFGEMEVQIGLVTLLRKFRFYRCAYTQVPMSFTKYSFLIAAESGLKLKVEKL